MAFNPEQFVKKDPSQDPEKLALETVKTIAKSYEMRGVIVEGTASDHYDSDEAKEQLITPLSNTIAADQKAGRDPGLWLPHTFLRVGFSPMQFREKFGGAYNPKNPVDIFNNRVMRSYGDVLKERPELPELGELAVLSTVEVGTRFNQHLKDPETYLTGMNRYEEINNWPGLLISIKMATDHDANHFTVADVVPQALSALALNISPANTHTWLRHIEYPSVGGHSLGSRWYSGKVQFSEGWGDDSVIGAGGVAVAESIK